MFRNLREVSENSGNGSKLFFRSFYDFLKFLPNLRKSSEVFVNHQNICGRDGNCSETFAIVRKFRNWFREVLKRTPAQVAVARK